MRDSQGDQPLPGTPSPKHVPAHHDLPEVSGNPDLNQLFSEPTDAPFFDSNHFLVIL
jgi:hypothetical protein